MKAEVYVCPCGACINGLRMMLTRDRGGPDGVHESISRSLDRRAAHPWYAARDAAKAEIAKIADRDR